MSTSDDFEWDDTKAAENYAAHGVIFEEARAVFSDPLASERLDDREDYGEERWVITGLAEGMVTTVVYTERNDRRRLISARRATRTEQDDYFTAPHLRDPCE
jgi:uncharacterized protein